ncbi:hypothetical protein [Bradyrhizobium sp. LMG 9283]|uniref:hypothetical protein n=1 Tax=Bradyrhizobium sp. LMG 9283 TaxID=592064 RepID=UPI00389096EF
MLVAMVVASVAIVAAKETAAAREALNAKAKLIAEIVSRGAVDVIWRFDIALAKASLAAIAADPDYVGSELDMHPLAELMNDAMCFPLYDGGNMGARRRNLHNIIKSRTYSSLTAPYGTFGD